MGIGPYKCKETIRSQRECVAYPEDTMYAIPALDKEFKVIRLPTGKDNPKGDGLYICVASFCDERQVGDQTK